MMLAEMSLSPSLMYYQGQYTKGKIFPNLECDTTREQENKGLKNHLNIRCWQQGHTLVTCSMHYIGILTNKNQTDNSSNLLFCSQFGIL